MCLSFLFVFYALKLTFKKVMKYYVVTKNKNKKNSQLLKVPAEWPKKITDYTLVRRDMKRDVDYRILKESEWKKIKRKYDIEIELKATYEITLVFYENVSMRKQNKKKSASLEELSKSQCTTKDITVYGIENVYDSFISLFFSPGLDKQKFMSEYMLYVEEVEIKDPSINYNELYNEFSMEMDIELFKDLSMSTMFERVNIVGYKIDIEENSEEDEESNLIVNLSTDSKSSGTKSTETEENGDDVTITNDGKKDIEKDSETKDSENLEDVDEEEEIETFLKNEEARESLEKLKNNEENKEDVENKITLNDKHKNEENKLNKDGNKQTNEEVSTKIQDGVDLEREDEETVNSDDSPIINKLYAQNDIDKINKSESGFKASENKTVTYTARVDFNLYSPVLAANLELSENGICGIPNLGNTCFMNSSIQALLNVPNLSKYFESIKGMSISDTKYRNVITEYMKLVDMTYIKSKHMSLVGFKAAMGKVNKMFALYEEQDAHEFLNYLLSCLHDGLLYDNEVDLNVTLNTSGFNSPISCLFFGKQKNDIECISCDYKKTKYEPFNMLSLSIPTACIDVIHQMKIYKIGNNRKVTDIVKKAHGKDEEFVYIPALYGDDNAFLNFYYKDTFLRNGKCMYIVYKVHLTKINILAKLHVKSYLFVYKKLMFDIMLHLDNKKYKEEDFMDSVLKKLYLETHHLILNKKMTFKEFKYYVYAELSDSVGVELNKINASYQNKKVFTVNIYIKNSEEIYGGRLALNENLKIEHCLMNFAQEEKVSMKCSQCDGNTFLMKQNIHKVSNYLIIHLKRFDGKGNKINTFVDFGATLKIDGDEFELISVICHFKVGIFYGHYVSYVKKDNSWYCCNDGVVSKGNVDKKNAYIMIYRRKKMRQRVSFGDVLQIHEY